MPDHRSFRLRTLPLLLATASFGLAHAETSPYYIGASVGGIYDSNVFRVPNRSGDKSLSLGVLGGFDQPIGRQRVYASGVLRNNRYDKQTQLDNTSYGVNAGLDWSTIEKLSGTLNFSGNNSLANYGGANTTQSTVKNIEKSSQASATVQYGMASLLNLTAGVTYRNLSYSDPAYQTNDLTQKVASVGINYRPSGALTLGTGLRFTRGEYANNGSTFDRRDLDLNLTYVPSGLSTLNARLSVGRQSANSGNAGNDFSGATGYLSWAYQPTGKLQINTWISRDTGASSGFLNFNGEQIRGIGDNSQTTNTLSVDAAYAATGKIKVNAGVRSTHRALVNGAIEGSDTVNSVSLGATYQALRNLQFSCSVGHEKRTAQSVLSYGYTASTVGCSGQITLQ